MCQPPLDGGWIVDWLESRDDEKIDWRSSILGDFLSTESYWLVNGVKKTDFNEPRQRLKLPKIIKKSKK